jgi:hypothetical protein
MSPFDEEQENRGNARRLHLPSDGDGAAAATTTEPTDGRQLVNAVIKTSDGLYVLNMNDAIMEQDTKGAKGDSHIKVAFAMLLQKGQVFVEHNGTYVKLSGKGMETHSGGKFFKSKNDCNQTQLHLNAREFDSKTPYFILFRYDGIISSASWSGWHLSAESKKDFESQVCAASGGGAAETGADQGGQDREIINSSSVTPSIMQKPPLKERKPKTTKKASASTQAHAQLKAPPEESYATAAWSASNVLSTQLPVDVPAVYEDDDDDDDESHKVSKEEVARSNRFTQQMGTAQPSSSAQLATSTTQKLAGMAFEALAESEQNLAASEINNQFLQKTLDEKESRIRSFQESLHKCQQELRKTTVAFEKECQNLHAANQQLQNLNSTLQDEIQALQEVKKETDADIRDLQDKNRKQKEEIQTLVEANEVFLKDHHGQQVVIHELQDKYRTQQNEIQELMDKTREIEYEARNDEREKVFQQLVKRETTISSLRKENFGLTRRVERLLKQLEARRASDERRKMKRDRREQELNLHKLELEKRALQLIGQCQDFLEANAPPIPNDREEEDDDDDCEEEEDNDGEEFDDYEKDDYDGDNEDLEDWRRRLHARRTPPPFLGPVP